MNSSFSVGFDRRPEKLEFLMGENALLPSMIRRKHMESELLNSELVDPILLGCEPGQLGKTLLVFKCRLQEDQFIRYCIALGDFFRRHGELSKAEEAYSAALARCDLRGEHSALGEALIRRGDVFFQLGRWKESTADLTLGRRIYRGLHQEFGVAQAESMLAINYAAGGDMKKARQFLARTLNSFDRIEEKYFLGVTHMNLGVVYQILGDTKSALARFQRARSHFEEIGDLARLGEVYHKLGLIFLATHSLTEAQSAFEMCHSLSTNTVNRTLAGLSFLGKALVNLAAGDLLLSLTLADQALDNFSIRDDRIHIAEVYRLKGTIHRRLNNVEFAHWYLYTSLKISSELRNVCSVGDCYFQLGKLHTLQRRPHAASKMFRKSVEFYRKGGALQETKLAAAELNRAKRIQ